jgi:hypothetical protein
LKISARVLCFGGVRPNANSSVTSGMIAEEVDAVPVAQRPKETGFRAIALDVREQVTGHTTRGEQRVGRLSQKLVHEANLEIHAAIHGAEELVVRAPELGVELLDAGVVPGDRRLVRRQLLHLPDESDVSAEALVDALDVGAARRPFLP